MYQEHVDIEAIVIGRSRWSTVLLNSSVGTNRRNSFRCQGPIESHSVSICVTLVQNHFGWDYNYPEEEGLHYLFSTCDMFKNMSHVRSLVS